MARLLVRQAHGVADLMHHGAQAGAAAADAQALAAGAGDLAHVRPAATRFDDVDVGHTGALGHLVELDAGVVAPVLDAGQDGVPVAGRAGADGEADRTGPEVAGHLPAVALLCRQQHVRLEQILTVVSHLGVAVFEMIVNGELWSTGVRVGGHR